ncbi:AMP-binding protein, partial [Thermodesulfobacteriota bacterium]
MTPFRLSTVTECLDRTARCAPRNGIALYSRKKDTDFIAYADLLQCSQDFAARMIEAGYRPGTLVGMFIPTSVTFFICYFGCLFARLTPVTLAAPMRFGFFQKRAAQRMRATVKNSGLRVLLDGYGVDKGLFHPGDMETIDVRQLPRAGKGRRVPFPAVSEEDLALIQYTSGSLSQPKGVMLSNANVSANIQAITEEVAMGRDDTVNLWLPLYHDMGLVGALTAINSLANLRLCSPEVFLFDPLRWLTAFAESGSTINPSPHFFFRMLNDSYDPERAKGLDLSRWRVAFNGSEMILPQDVRRFLRLYGSHGFREETMYPVYGLAEATLGLIFPRYGSTLSFVRGVQAFGGTCPAHMAEREFISVGRAIKGHSVRIDSPNAKGEHGITLPEAVGEVMANGPSIMKGYFDDPDMTRQVLADDGWLATQDLGFEHGGSIYISGRLKEVIIHRGVNYFPEDFEETVDQCEALEELRVPVRAAFALTSEGRETIAVALEMKNPRREDGIERLLVLKGEISDLFGVDASIFWLRPRSIPRTTSGKPQRMLLAERLEKGQIEPVA